MLRNYYINKEWMLSRTARLAYRTAAGWSFALIPMLFVLASVEIPKGFLPVMRLLVFACIVGMATTTIAMEYFLFGFDDSSAWNKTFWFVVSLVPSVGAPLYCFVVYSRSGVLKRYAMRAEQVTGIAKV
jgi:hypothetical protein